MAGKIIANNKVGKWVRPIGNQSHAISETECQCSDKKGLRHLDTVTIPCANPIPHLHQQENHQISSGKAWSRDSRFRVSNIAQLIDAPASLWTNSTESQHGKNDRVTEDEISLCHSSLYLIIPSSLSIVVDAPRGSKRVRAQFTYNSIEYNLSITDIAIQSEYANKKVNSYDIEPAPMCVSLAEKYQHSNGECFYYKVSASILIPGNHV